MKFLSDNTVSILREHSPHSLSHQICILDPVKVADDDRVRECMTVENETNTACDPGSNFIVRSGDICALRDVADLRHYFPMRMRHNSSFTVEFESLGCTPLCNVLCLVQGIRI